MRLLGSGGSVSVFEARDFTTERMIALKILHPHLSTSAEMKKGFLLEASAAESVRHPNIALVLGYGIHGTDDDSVAWIALERAAGISLAEHVRLNGALRPQDALTVADGLLAALEAAHAQGMVHRDVSPANVMVDYAAGPGSLRAIDVCLVDFGLADLIGRATTGSDVVRSTTTESAAKGVLGSVNYMSPEQASGQPVGVRGDIYQTGATLYFALTGQAPYQRSTPEAVMRAHLEAPPPVPSVVAQGIPTAVDRIVVTAMSSVEADRYGSATQMRRVVRGANARGAATDHTRLLPGQQADVREAHRSTADRLTADVPGADHAGRVATAADRRWAQRAGENQRSERELVVHSLTPVRRGGLAVLIATGAIGSVLAIAVLLASSGASGSSTAGSPSMTPAASPQPSSTAISSVRPAAAPNITVPRLVALSLDEARTALSRVGLALGTVSSINSPAAAQTVLSVPDGEGAGVALGARIDLVVASGVNIVPRVVGLSASAALDAVRSAGFSAVRHDQEDPDPDHASGTVLGSDPAEATALPIGAGIIITVSILPPTPRAFTPSPSASPSPGPAPSPAPSTGPTSRPVSP
ncbi:protein kinase [Frigoribacterium sp. CG_9.8]|uniref:protein kinase domain-containing protein n=1 Tax=Frigoribacterium sp. CG_9.8 TaxID=2787733 RepID=UPI0018CAD02D|nr:serine/threonine-protein kinase [Frigoribacterium sp. CG_9.8]